MIKAILIYWAISNPTVHYSIEFSGMSQCSHQLRYIQKVTKDLSDVEINGFCVKK